MEAQSDGERRRERVAFETDRHMVVGNLTLPPHGYQSRLSDAINRGDIDFIPIVDAEITPIGGGEAERRAFLALSKRHVRLAYPLDEPA